MKAILCFFSLLSLLFVTNAFAVQRMPQDIKLPSQLMLEHETITNALALNADAALDGHAGATAAAAVTVTSFLAQPDVPRNVTVTPMATTADIKAGTVTVTGTDVKGAVISEAYVFLDNASTVIVGAKAFKTITSISFPAEDSPYGGTWDVGYGDKLGLDACMDAAGYFIKALADGAADTVTATASATVVASNGFTPTTVADGAVDYEIIYIQNFRCD